MTLRSQLLANISMVALTIELRVSQNEPDGNHLVSDTHKAGQVSVPRSTPRVLSQHQLPIQVDNDQPLQPMPSGQRLLRVVMHTPDEKGANRALGQSGGVNSDAGTPSAPSESAHRFPQDVLDDALVQPLEKAVQRPVVGHTVQAQQATELSVFPEPHLSLPEGPVLVAHQTEDRQQLRLG